MTMGREKSDGSVLLKSHRKMDAPRERIGKGTTANNDRATRTARRVSRKSQLIGATRVDNEQCGTFLLLVAADASAAER